MAQENALMKTALGIQINRKKQNMNIMKQQENPRLCIHSYVKNNNCKTFFNIYLLCSSLLKQNRIHTGKLMMEKEKTHYK